MGSSTTPHHAPLPISATTSLRADERPATIAELAERAHKDLWDPSRELKHWLRVGHRYRLSGKEHLDNGDLESAFVEFARAATIVLEKLPTHKDYMQLTGPQRHNLGLNGQEMLDNLSRLKPRLVERHEAWRRRYGSDGRSPEPRARAEPIRRNTSGRGDEHAERRRESEEASRRPQDKGREYQEYRRREEERRAAKAEEEEEEEDAFDTEPEVARARFERMTVGPQQQPVASASGHYTSRHSRDSDDPTRKQQEQQAEMRRREEDIRARRRVERDGITQRQQEAEAAARHARRSRSPSPLPPSGAFPGDERRRDDMARRQQQAQSAARAALDNTPDRAHSGLARHNTMPDEPIPRRLPNRPEGAPATRPLGPSATASASTYLQPEPMPMPLPLESPTKYDGDTDTESLAEDRSGWRHQQAASKQRSRTPARTSSYPPPVTTTSPAPSEVGPIRYPTLMTQHQLKQGYSPSLQSMFAATKGPPPPAVSNASLLFGSQGGANSLYPSSMLPQPSAPVVPPHPPQEYGAYGGHYRTPGAGSVSYSGRSPNAPRPQAHGASYPQMAPPAQGVSRIESRRGEDPVTRELKTVSLPRECLPRFLSIASVNTTKNKETCGLLLGKDKGHKFVVTTLLIPKQHSTSDTCTMDEEELVLQFTEERGLITLGWIHTHPSQSCFMSSVDLHTHSGFQRMLPESFAVVCAPKFTPSFGIFRLTDPPGLQTILDCTAKEAFHPHAEVPIYTDADKGHVVMKDMALEIVDLR